MTIALWLVTIPRMDDHSDHSDIIPLEGFEFWDGWPYHIIKGNALPHVAHSTKNTIYIFMCVYIYRQLYTSMGVSGNLHWANDDMAAPLVLERWWLCLGALHRRLRNWLGDGAMFSTEIFNGGLWFCVVCTSSCFRVLSWLLYIVFPTMDQSGGSTTSGSMISTDSRDLRVWQSPPLAVPTSNRPGSFCFH